MEVKKKILVILKQVPGMKEKKDYQDTDVLNQSDKNLLMEALNLGEDMGAEVDVMVHGPKSAENILREALTYGVHQAILVTNEKKQDYMVKDPGKAVALTAEEKGMYDLFFCGRQAVDGDSAHAAAVISGTLRIPLIPYARKTWTEGKQIFAVCAGDEGDRQISCEMPAMVLSVREKGQNRYPTAAHIIRTYSGEYKVDVIKMKEDPEQNAGITQSRKYEIRQNKKEKNVMFSGKNAKEASEKMVKILKKWDVL